MTAHGLQGQGRTHGSPESGAPGSCGQYHVLRWQAGAIGQAHARHAIPRDLKLNHSSAGPDLRALLPCAAG